MSWWIKEHIAVNDDETKQLCSIEADNQTSLPAADQSATAGFIIVRGSSALVLDTGDRYIMNSGSTWIQQPSGVQLDLSGYATTQDLTDGLAEKIDTTTYTAGQAAQDAAIATKVSISDLYPADRRTTDISSTTDPGIYRFYGRNATTNLPTDISAASPFGLLQVLKTSTYIAQILINFVSANPPDVYVRRSSDSGSSWTTWLKVSGTTVA